MRKSVIASLLLVGAVLVPPFEAVAAPADCVFTDTSGTNSGYMEGPGLKAIGVDSWDLVTAYLNVHESANGTWSKATDRVNGPRHTLSSGTWSVTFEYGGAYREINADPGVEAVSRIGAQVEHFSGSPNVYLNGDQRELSNTSGEVDEPAGSFVITIDVATSAEYGGLFYVDAHARPNAGSGATVWTQMEVERICWRKISDEPSESSMRRAGTVGEGLEGILCGFTAVTDPNPEADTHDMTGEIDAGPATTDVPGTLHCDIQVGANWHSGANAARRSFPSDANGVIAGVETVTYSIAEDAQDYICASFDPDDPDDPTLYLTGGDDAHWHTDPHQACTGATQIGTEDVRDIVRG